MTIFIKRENVAEKDATRFIPEVDGLVKQIVRVWHESNTDHRFKDKKSFKRAVRRNKKTLQSVKHKTFFIPSNYRFSTKAKHRKETLYFRFEDPTRRQTGRLRQQHPKGPLATIDEKPRKDRFVSEKRFDELPEDKPKRLPTFYPYEQRPKDGKHHIEFAREGKSISDWHRSEGTVKKKEMSKRHLKCLIDSALGNILGIAKSRVT